MCSLTAECVLKVFDLLREREEVRTLEDGKGEVQVIICTLVCLICMPYMYALHVYSMAL